MQIERGKRGVCGAANLTRGVPFNRALPKLDRGPQMLTLGRAQDLRTPVDSTLPSRLRSDCEAGHDKCLVPPASGLKDMPLPLIVHDLLQKTRSAKPTGFTHEALFKLADCASQLNAHAIRVHDYSFLAFAGALRPQKADGCAPLAQQIAHSP
jgi:hypothetical protein